MHISEGILAGPVLAAGWAAAGTGVAVGLARMDTEKVAETGLLSAAFFVASLVHVPFGPGSVHLILNGLVGLILGWAAVPAIAVALALQAVFFQFGGITTLGVNTVIMAAPALCAYYLFGPLVRRGNRKAALAAGFGAGSVAVLLSAVVAAASLVFTGEAFFEAAVALAGFHLPVMAIEGLVTMFCVGFLKKVHPALLKEN